MGPRLHGDDDGRTAAQAHSRDDGIHGRTHIVIPAEAGIHGGGPAGMGPRLHGDDDGRRRRTHIPATMDGGRTQVVIPAEAGIHGGGPAGMGPRLHGNDGGRRAHPHSRDGGWS